MKLCAQCQADISHRASPSVYCFNCALERLKVRIAPTDRKRAGDLQHRRVDGQIVCRDCPQPLSAVFCGKKRRPPLRCPECRGAHDERARRTGRSAASLAVAKAKQAGLLKPAATFKCTDCERMAEVYDHRDYSKPLDVDPVCRSCNVIRGPAKYVEQTAEAS